MKQLSTLFRRVTALMLVAALTLSLTAYAAAPQHVLASAQSLLDGLRYRNVISTTDAGRLESFAVELSPDTSLQPILLQGSGKICGSATIDTTVARAQELGYQVYAAINTAYFDTANGIPLGIVIENGVYKCSTAGSPAMLIGEDGISLSTDPQVSLTLTNTATGAVVTPNHFNRLRVSDGGSYLLNSDFSSGSTRTNTSGWYVRFRVTEGGTLGVNSTLSLEVTEVLRSDQPLTIGDDEYILTADDNSWLYAMYQSFHVGETYRLESRCTDPALSAAQWAGGTGAILVQNGTRTDKSTWVYSDNSRAPRSALGVRSDGTLLLYTADGRQTDYSVGLTLTDLADEMVALGCEWAVNLDGGGSSALSVWLPAQNGAMIQNSPSDGTPRRCSTYLLIVGTDDGDNLPHTLAPTENGLCVLVGSEVTLPSTVILDNALHPLGIERDPITTESMNHLGTITNNVYRAGKTAGTDTLILWSDRLSVGGSMQLHVVDTLSTLNVYADNSTAALTSLTLCAGDTVQLSVDGTYYGREALRGNVGAVYSVSESLGTVTQTGLLTISPNASKDGTLTVSAGGLTKTIPITLDNVHVDVTSDHWAFSAIDYCYRNGIVNGVSPSEFGPDYLIRRGDFILMLYNALDTPAVSTPCTFTDVAESDYFYNAMAWAQEQGLVNGVGDGLALPKEPITREQAFTILRKALPLLQRDCPDAPLSVLSSFADTEQIAEYALPHTATLVAQGIVVGNDAYINPKGNLTRAEMATLIQRVMTHTPLTEYPDTPDDSGETGDGSLLPPIDETPDTSPDETPDDSTDTTPPEDTPEASLTLDFVELTVWSTETYPLTATLYPAVDDAEITWVSSDPTIATVTPNGEVTNLYTGTGTATVTITASWGDLSASCLISCPQAGLTGSVYNVTGELNIRAGAGTNYPVQGKLHAGDVVVVLDHRNGWYKILYSDASQACIGYVNAKYMLLNLF